MYTFIDHEVKNLYIVDISFAFLMQGLSQEWKK